MQQIAIFTTGGTIDKVYFDAKGGYEVGGPVVRQVLEHARAGAAIPVVELLRKDSLEMTAADREAIRAAVAAAAQERIIVTHGTDTMVETARALQDVPAKTIVLTGALQPGRLSDSDAPFNLGMALAALLDGETDFIANAANLTALVYTTLPDLNWAGCYLLRGAELVLGPFQGKPACVRIALGRGVCGSAAARREAVIVPDVHAFPGHIACDAASRSELVVPVLEPATGRLLGVFAVDSPLPAGV